MYGLVLFNKPSERYIEFKDYCLTDSVIVYRALIKFFEFINKVCNIDSATVLKKYVTLSGLAYSVFQEYNPQMQKWLTMDCSHMDDYLGLRSVYKGGFCDVNDDFKCIDMKGTPVTSYDINSAYPAAVVNHPLPFTMDKDAGYDYVDTIYCFVANSEIRANSNLRFIFKDEFKVTEQLFMPHPSRFEPTSIFYLWGKEFEWFKKYYDGDIAIIREWKFYGGKIDQGGYMEYFYDLKKHFKAKKNTAFLTLTKLMLNAVTGKFGQRPLFDNKVIFCDQDEAKVYEYDRAINRRVGKMRKLSKSNDDTFYIYKSYFDDDLSATELTEVHNFFIVSYITMLTRTLIYSFIEKIGIGNWLYSDTDSLKSLVKIKDPSLVGPDLGQFKDEGTTLSSMFYHAKAY